MASNKPYELRTSGELTLNSISPTLGDLEAFCAEARRLGLDDDVRLRITRQGALGPVIGWHFAVPVVPKVDANDA